MVADWKTKVDFLDANSLHHATTGSDHPTFSTLEKFALLAKDRKAKASDETDVTDAEIGMEIVQLFAEAASENEFVKVPYLGSKEKPYYDDRETRFVHQNSTEFGSHKFGNEIYPFVTVEKVLDLLNTDPAIALQAKVLAANTAYKLFKNKYSTDWECYNPNKTLMNEAFLNGQEILHNPGGLSSKEVEYLAQIASNGKLNRDIPFTSALYAATNKLKP